MNKTAVDIKNLELNYGDKSILSDFSLSISEAEHGLLIGRNGSGKTTLFRALAGLMQPTQGSIRVFGADLRSLSPGDRASTICWIPSENHFSFAYTCFELLLLARFPWHSGFPTSNDRQIVAAALESLSISDFSDRSILELSQGEKQKVMLARALSTEAKIILIDEPLAHLDIGASYQFIKILSESLKTKTVLFSIHDLLLARTLDQRAIVLDNQSLKWDGLARVILSKENIETLAQTGIDI